ncbi:MAG: MFS transporter, partial [Proteobacteria bacterium]|nr:MFS transporter [Pseudomonadota bacterium]
MERIVEAHTKELPVQAPDERRYRYWRRNANTLAAGNLLTNLGWSAAFAFLPLVVKDMNTGGRLELWVGIISFGYFCMSCLFTPVWGVLADHYGRRSMVLRAGLGMGVGFTLTSFVHDPLHLLLALMLVGLANGYVPAGQILVAMNTPRNKVGGVLAFTQSFAWIGSMLGPMAGAVLIGFLSRPGDLFILAGATTMSAGLLVLFLVREGHVRPAHPLQFNMRADVKR